MISCRDNRIIIKERLDNIKYTIPYKNDLQVINTDSWFDININNLSNINNLKTKKKLKIDKQNQCLTTNDNEIYKGKFIQIFPNDQQNQVLWFKYLIKPHNETSCGFIHLYPHQESNPIPVHYGASLEPISKKLSKHKVSPPGIEPGTYSLEGCRSIQLSYGDTCATGQFSIFKQVLIS